MTENGKVIEEWSLAVKYGSVSRVVRVMHRNYHDPPRHRTRRYREAMEIIARFEVKQQAIKEVLKWFFYQDRFFTMDEKLAIDKISYCPESRIIVVHTTMGDRIYDNRNTLARETGWYFYVTGPEMQKSELSSRVDGIPKRFDQTKFRWSADGRTSMDLMPIATGPDRNGYLLSFGDKNILLDAGLGPDGLEYLNHEARVDLDAVFVSHAHYDHTSELLNLVEAFPEIPILLTQTTLDFFLLQRGSLSREFSPAETKLIQNSLFVKNGDTLHFMEPENSIRFFFAGHMPGALMFLLELGGYRFLYTGDYTFYTYSPMPGIHGIVESIPTPIDFILVDGTFSNVRFNPPRDQYGFLMDQLKLEAVNNNNVLIGADPASLAINLFITIHNEFLKLKEEMEFERPSVYLNRKVYEFARVLCSRLEDLEPKVAGKIRKELNPFQSAVIRWINDWQDKRNAEADLRSTPKSQGTIVIFDPPDLDHDWMLDFLRTIGSDPHGAIYLAGPLRNPTAIELVSGVDDLMLQYRSGEMAFHNNARVLNRDRPDNIVNLHADESQLRLLISRTQPRRVCLFQQSPRKLISVRNWMVKDYPFVKETLVFYEDVRQKVHLR